MPRRISTTMRMVMLVLFWGNLGISENVKNQIDLSKTAVILPFKASVKGAFSLPDATRTAVIQCLKDEGVFFAVLTPEEAKDKDPSAFVEISATLGDFGPGNKATRMAVGLGSGRAHAGFDFTVRDSVAGTVLWRKHINETASFWSNSESSVAQRAELPEKVAKSLVKEIKKARAR